MAKISSVLFPVDLAGNVEAPLKFARDLARQLGAKLHVFYVVREFDFARGIFIPHENVDRMEEEYRGAAGRHMEEVRGKFLADEPGVTTAVAFGSPAEQILRYAEEHNIDLIALVTHGRTGLQHILLGSVAEQVVRMSPRPVMTIRPENL